MNREKLYTVLTGIIASMQIPRQAKQELINLLVEAFTEELSSAERKQEEADI